MLGRSATLEPISDGNQHCTGSKGGSARHRGKESNVTQLAERSMSEASIKYFREKPRHPFVIKTVGELSQQLSSACAELALAIWSNVSLQRNA